MIQEGIYKAEFRTPIGMGSGVVFLQGGQLHGGDSTMYYQGTYAENGDRFTADFRINQHTVVAGLASVFGVNQAQVHIAGNSTPTSARATGTSPQAPGVNFQVALTKLP